MTPPQADGRTISHVPQGPFREQLIQLMGEISLAQRYVESLSHLATGDRDCIRTYAIEAILGRCSLALSLITGFTPEEGVGM